MSVIKTAAVTVDSASPTLLATGGSGVVWVAAGGVLVYLGGADVTAGDGVPIAPSASASDERPFELGVGEKLYGLAASGTQVARVLRSDGSQG